MYLLLKCVDFNIKVNNEFAQFSVTKVTGLGIFLIKHDDQCKMMRDNQSWKFDCTDTVLTISLIILFIKHILVFTCETKI